MGLPLPAITFQRERQTPTGLPAGGVLLAVCLGTLICLGLYTLV